jgi:predicted DNA-binding antitoxin AbrB/MazE fold protein
MQKTIEVIYEKGVFKPLEKVKLKEGRKAKVPIEKERGIISSEDINEITDTIKTLTRSKISQKKIR